MTEPSADHGELLHVFPGDTEMARRMRAFDWTRTPLGKPATWPQSLRSAVSALLVSKAQIIFIWGDDLTTFYNDAYRPVFGSKHPDALGLPVREAWSEIWAGGLEELFGGVLSSGEAFWAQDRPFFIERHGYLEETYFDVSYDPVRDESGRVRGVYCIVTETTGRVVGERRLTTLRDLGRIAEQKATVAEVYRAAADVLRQSADVPFAVLYGVSSSDAAPTHIADSGLEHFSPASLRELAGLARSCVELTIVDTDGLLHAGPLHGGQWREPIRQVAVVPLALKGQPAEGCLVAGISPRRQFDDEYRKFLGVVASNIAGAATTVRRTEEERRRAEVLAELDRAKTVFFSNVSHEFRTPLTLMLGLLEETIGAAGVPEESRQSLQVAHRNTQRLLKLVNTLLDFSRIEAGRADASYEEVDIARLTSDLASVFRSAFERAGLSLAVRCEKPRAPVFVDGEMWEKVLLNLLSNAFKYTLAGGTSVVLTDEGTHFDLRVSDSGIGIPPEEIPHVFTRFYRVRGTEGRTHEGTGIGLALVQELVKLHGGVIEVSSELGKGTTFRVRIPTGHAHLPKDRIGAKRELRSTTVGAAPFVEEALRWLPDADGSLTALPTAPVVHVRTAGSRVVLADDNADMRAYTARLLSPYWHVESFPDGEAALRAIRESRPDLVVADIMMPRLDGLQLLRALRADSALTGLPVILLSARAGEESRIEGLNAGADDYFAKPFSARELIARVDAQLCLARERRAAEQALRYRSEQLETLLEEIRQARIEAEDANRAKDEFLATVSHELRSPLQGILGWLTLLKQDRFDATQRSRALESVERSVRLQAQLVHDIMDISRIVAGKVEITRAPIDLTAIVGSTVDEFMPGAVSKEVELTLEGGHCGIVLGDRERLHQVFANLISNALKFTQPGGRIVLACTREDGECVVTVTDTGEGIEPHFLPRLFDRFSQADASSTRRHGGLGLGLAIVKHLVGLHGGTVNGASEGRGRGATFQVRLPEELPSSRQRHVPSAVTEPPAIRLDGVEILLVEDDRDSLEAMTLVLQATGAVVRAAASASEAWSAFSQRPPDVLVSDLSMPDEDGYSLLRRIRAQAAPDGVPAIALTGYTRPEDKQRVLAAGFVAHVPKPVRPDVLVKVLGDVLGRPTPGTQLH